MLKTIVRKASPNDAIGICIVQQKTWIDTYESAENGVSRSELEEYTKSWTTIENVEKIISMIRESSQHWLVAEQQGVVVGHIRILLKKGDYALIDMLYILPSAQKQGLGSLLFNTALKTIKSDIIVDVVDFNSAAILFYEKHGFHFLKKEPNSAKPLPSGKTFRLIRLIKNAHI